MKYLVEKYKFVAINNLVILMLITLHAMPQWKKRGEFEFFTVVE